jgi:hypothetical protein
VNVVVDFLFDQAELPVVTVSDFTGDAGPWWTVHVGHRGAPRANFFCSSRDQLLALVPDYPDDQVGTWARQAATLPSR